MNKNILVPDELILDLSLPEEEIKKQLNDYEEACNKVAEQWDLDNKKENK